tara:strand:+ start:11081 stop:11281 length:201 start_codon:yes stop_codon:yes gene_type:complete
MSQNKCPCGERTTPDPCCDMCDGWTNDPDTGWGGFTDGYLKKHFNSEEERKDYIEKNGYVPEEDED